MTHIKTAYIDQIITHLEEELQHAMTAANEAHAAATDDQSVAETQYDTLAIEASYLAHGQSQRAYEYQQGIIAYKALAKSLEKHSHIEEVTLGSLIQLSEDEQLNKWYFLGPAAGGFSFKTQNLTIIIITPQSPLGEALMGKAVEDDINLALGNKQLDDYISQIS
ncbi:hypothetical protein [Litorilituus lipolyticus]|uniref:Transcription elongation factor GreAB n=1 Tax=Litorilituus lipolyticus TaxID=2491017 RepID=A0A502KUE2_9GAMM|nr:hypothetical protein [Litorilituus lipolyticus]TPH15116.1 hypothetical protein EPA86_09875 [Litorilituus lipolyticus]